MNADFLKRPTLPAKRKPIFKGEKCFTLIQVDVSVHGGDKLAKFTHMKRGGECTVNVNSLCKCLNVSGI